MSGLRLQETKLKAAAALPSAVVVESDGPSVPLTVPPTTHSPPPVPTTESVLAQLNTIMAEHQRERSEQQQHLSSGKDRQSNVRPAASIESSHHVNHEIFTTAP